MDHGSPFLIKPNNPPSRFKGVELFRQFFPAHVHQERKFLLPDTLKPSQGHKQFNAFLLFSLIKELQLTEHPFLEPLFLSGQGVQNLAAADGTNRRVTPEDITVPFQNGRGRIQPELGQTGFTGIQFIPVQQNQGRDNFCRTRMETHFGPVLELARCTRKKVQDHIQHVG